MKINRKFQQPVAVFLVLAKLHLCWVSSFAWAGMVATMQSVITVYVQ